MWAHGDGPKEPINSLVSALVASAIDVFSPTWSRKRTAGSEELDHDKVYQAGLQLLSSVVGVIRSSDLWSCPSWNQVYHTVHEINYLPPAVSTIQLKFSTRIFNEIITKISRYIANWYVASWVLLS